MAAVTTDEQVLACVSQLAEFCEKLGVSAEASTLATRRLRQIVPLCCRKVASPQDAAHWCACAIWSAGVEAGAPASLSDLLAATGVKLQDLLSDAGYLNDWMAYSRFPDSHVVCQAVVQLKKLSGNFLNMRIKWAQLLSSGMSAPKRKHDGLASNSRLASKELEDFGWNIFVLVRADLGESLMPCGRDQPEILRWYYLLVACLHVLLKSVPATELDEAVKTTVLQRAYSYQQLQQDGVNTLMKHIAGFAAKMCTDGQFRADPAAPGDSPSATELPAGLLSAEHFKQNLSASNAVALAVTGPPQHAVAVDGRWYNAIEHDKVQDPQSLEAAADSRPAKRQSTATDVVLTQVGDDDDGHGMIPMTDSSSDPGSIEDASAGLASEAEVEKNQLLAAQMMASWGVAAEVSEPDHGGQPPPRTMHPGVPPGTPVRASFQEDQWIDQRINMLPDAPCPNGIDPGCVGASKVASLAPFFSNASLLEDMIGRVDGLTERVRQSATSQNTWDTDRMELCVKLYYSSLYSMLSAEKDRLNHDDFTRKVTSLLRNDMFHKGLFACSCELVYNQQGASHTLSFSDILLAVGTTAFDFFKLLPSVMQHIVTGAPRSIIARLQDNEKEIVEKLAWTSDSPVFELLAPLPEQAGDKSLGNGSSKALRLFFSKVLWNAETRLRTIATQAGVSQLVDPCWRCLTNIFSAKREMLRDRHLDPLILSTIYAAVKVFGREQPHLGRVTFKSIIKHYKQARLQWAAKTSRSADSAVLRKILLRAEPAGGAGPQYGDVIKFYNDIYVPQMKLFLTELMVDPPPSAPMAAPSSPTAGGSTGHAAPAAPPPMAGGQRSATGATPQPSAAAAAASKDSVAKLNLSILASPMKSPMLLPDRSAHSASGGGSGALHKATPRTKLLMYTGDSVLQRSAGPVGGFERSATRLGQQLNFDEPASATAVEGVLQRRMMQIGNAANLGPVVGGQ